MAGYETGTPRLLRARDRADLVEETFRHPFNSRSELHGCDLARAAGLARTGLILARVPPHLESYAPHSHAAQEEWLFVVRGRGIVDIGDESHEIGPGDFVGFPAGAPAHHVRNPSDEDLVYLCGGERGEVDVIEYPSSGKVVIRVGAEMKVYPLRAGEPVFR
jgi:uncharacterized cupin superfamily protein